jgi:Zn-dependent protease with chaperone function
MEHRPQLPDEDVNVSNTSPVRELLRLGAAVIVIGLLIFVLTGLLVDGIVNLLPRDTGRSLQPRVEAAFLQQLGEPYTDQREARARALFAELLEAADLDGDDYTLLVVDNDMINALAGPANVIAVLRGLLDVVESENELAMVLGHELGHLHHRDPFRSLGRGVILAGLAAIVFGNGDAINRHLIMSSTGALERRYSRRRELAADRYGLALVCQVYGHRGGTADFFQRIGDDHEMPVFFSTHPLSGRRIQRLNAFGESLNCPIGAATPFE